MRFLRRCLVGLLLAGLSSAPVLAAGRLVIEKPWIRAAPPAAPMRAGYAVLRNDGDAPLTVIGASSALFADVSIHATLVEDGVARMRELPEIRLEPGASVALEPGGKHLMLMRPAKEIETGFVVELRFEMQDGTSSTAGFVVREAGGGDAHAHH